MSQFIESEMARALKLVPDAKWEIMGSYHVFHKGNVAHSVNLDNNAQPYSKQDMRELITSTIADAVASDVLHQGTLKWRP